MRRKNDRLPTTEQGAALFALLFSLVLIAGLVHSLSTYSTHYGKLAYTYTHGARTRELLRRAIYSRRLAHRGCVESYVDGSDTMQRAITICSLGELAFRFEPSTQELSRAFSGRPDYASLFARETSCPTSLRVENLRSYTSPVSPQRCVVPILRASTIMRHNIEAAAIELNSQTDITTIGTPGELMVTNVLSTEGDLLIVTGGRIRIPSLICSSGRSVRVTLLSAHGDIEVGAIAPGVSLLSIGRRLISVPRSAATTGYPLPPLTLAGVSGIVM